MLPEVYTALDLLDIYVLNLVLTLGMFVVLIARAAFEYRYYGRLSADAERRANVDLMRRVLRSEKELFDRTEEGKELYELLCEMFDVRLPEEK